MDIWVNADATSDPATATISAGTGTVDSVRLGLVDGLGGFGGGAIFDAYEAHSATAVGLLNKFDADGNSSINVLDAVAQINEINEISLAAGQPDCNLSGGNINVLDAVCIINYINAQ
jgi:hypothetical protein